MCRMRVFGFALELLLAGHSDIVQNKFYAICVHANTQCVSLCIVCRRNERDFWRIQILKALSGCCTAPHSILGPKWGERAYAHSAQAYFCSRRYEFDHPQRANIGGKQTLHYSFFHCHFHSVYLGLGLGASPRRIVYPWCDLVVQEASMWKVREITVTWHIRMHGIEIVRVVHCTSASAKMSKLDLFMCESESNENDCA